MVRPQSPGGGDTGTICALFFALTLSACAEYREFSTGAPPPPEFVVASAGMLDAVNTTIVNPSPDDLQPHALMMPDAVPMASVNYMGTRQGSFMGSSMGGSILARQSGFNTAFSPSLALAQHGDNKADCHFGDRFDRKTTLAYNFDNNHQLAFKMGISNHGSNGIEMTHALLAFHYRFNTVKSPMEPEPAAKCRYASHWQGIVGSSYNELMLRQTNTVWGEAKDRGLDFWH